MIEVDPFAERCRTLFTEHDHPVDGKRGLLFRYFYQGETSSPRHWRFMAGIWIDDSSYRRTQYTHDLPSSSCEREVRRSGAHCRPSAPVVIGLPVYEEILNNEKQISFLIPQGILEDYCQLAMVPEISIKEELEQRFNVSIKTS